MKPRLQAVPDLPDEGALVEKRAVLLEELVAQPVVERLVAVAGGGEQAFQHARATTPRHTAAASRRWRRSAAAASPWMAAQADDAVLVRQRFQAVRAERRAVGKLRAGLPRPAVAEQAGDGDLQRLGRAARMPGEKPLRRVVRVRLG